jgi:hypothetical protein
MLKSWDIISQFDKYVSAIVVFEKIQNGEEV